MVSFKTNSCRLCLNNIIDKNYYVIKDVTREVLEVFSPKLGGDGNGANLICSACYTKLMAAFNFKSTCLYTEDTIFPYMSEENAVLNLGEIYVKEKKNRPLANDEAVCRLCMQPVKTYLTMPMQELDLNMARKLLPEMNFNIIKDAVVCTQCRDSLDIHTKFLRNCLDADDKSETAYPSDSNLNDDVKIEIEENEPLEMSTGTLPAEDPEESKPIRGIPVSRKGGRKGRPPLGIRHRCHECGYESKRKDHLRLHVLRHKDPSEVPMHKCDECDYQTIQKGKLNRHKLGHRDVSEVEMHKCDKCHYQSKYKDDLRTHQVMHQDPSEALMYKCDKCDFESIRKGALARHVLMHEQPSDGALGCKRCDFQTRYRHLLTLHMRTHRDRSVKKIYKCDKCDYRANNKGNLQRHRLAHEAIFRYQCDECQYKCKQKGNLQQHKLTHRDRHEVQLYKCDRCQYDTKQKSCLKLHMARHMQSSLKYACDECDYKTPQRGRLEKHRLKHRDTSEVPMYKCDKCKFETKYKYTLMSHALRQRCTNATDAITSPSTRSRSSATRRDTRASE